ncbi:hypothetical protein L0F63_004450, partial [Massospora cicadina]
MAVSILLSRPPRACCSNRDPRFEPAQDDPSGSAMVSELDYSWDRSWIVLPRGYFVNLGVYFSGFVLLVSLCFTLDLNLAYPPIQFGLYLVYILYTIYPQLRPRAQKFVEAAWPPQLFKSFGLSATPTPEVPTVIVTDSDLLITNEPEIVTANIVEPIATPTFKRSFNNSHTTLDTRLPASRSNNAALYSIPKLTITPDSPSTKTQGGSSSDLQIQPGSSQPPLPTAHSSPAQGRNKRRRPLGNFDPPWVSGAGGLLGHLSSFPGQIDSLANRNLSRGVLGWLVTVLTLPIAAPILLSVVPSLGVWTMIDRGTEAWDEVDFNFGWDEPEDLRSRAQKSQLGWGKAPRCTASRALILRQLIAMPEAGALNYRRFQAFAFPWLGSLCAISLGYVDQLVFFGVPGVVVGLGVGCVLGGISLCLTYNLPATAKRYRELLAKYLELSRIDFISPLYLSPLPFITAPDEDYLSPPIPPMFQDSPGPEFLEVADGGRSPGKGSRPWAKGEAGSPSMAATQRSPSPAISIRRQPSWATTFDALNGRSSSHSSPALGSPLGPSLSPNQQLRDFLLKTKPDLGPLDFIFYVDSLLVLLGIVTAILYINAASGLLMALLTFLADLLNLPSTLVGMTVLAWGNSISDLASATGMAKGGYPMIALTSTLAGPVLNLLLTFGVGLCSLLINNHPIKLPAMPSVTWVAVGFIAANCLLILTFALPSKTVSGRVRRPGLAWLPYLQLTNFLAFLVALVTAQ